MSEVTTSTHTHYRWDDFELTFHAIDDSIVHKKTKEGHTLKYIAQSSYEDDDPRGMG